MTRTGSRSERESIITSVIWWVVERPLWLRVIAYGSLPVVGFVLPLLDGSGLGAALTLASLQTAVMTVAVLVALGLRRLF
jgi:hypothetical protein